MYFETWEYMFLRHSLAHISYNLFCRYIWGACPPPPPPPPSIPKSWLRYCLSLQKWLLFFVFLLLLACQLSAGKWGPFLGAWGLFFWREGGGGGGRACQIKMLVPPPPPYENPRPPPPPTEKILATPLVQGTKITQLIPKTTIISCLAFFLFKACTSTKFPLNVE